MSYGNPYESSQNSRPSGGQNNQQRSFQGGNNRFQQEPLTPEQLQRLKLPVWIVVGGDDRLPESIKPSIEEIVKKIEAKYVPVRCRAFTEGDLVVHGAGKRLEYHLPWKGWNSKDHGVPEEIKGMGSTFNEDSAFEFAKRYYIGDFESINKVQRAAHGANARLLFGKKLKNPASLVILWTEDGAECASATNSRSGINGHLIRMASAAGITVINLKNDDAMSRINAYLENIHVQQPPEQQESSRTADRAESRQHNGNGSSGFRGPIEDDEIGF